MRQLGWSLIIATLLVASDSRGEIPYLEGALGAGVEVASKADSVRKAEERRWEGVDVPPRPGLGEFITNFILIMVEALRAVLTGEKVRSAMSSATPTFSEPDTTSTSAAGGGSP